MHVVFGAGQVGSGLARRLAEAGQRVRVVRRGPAAVGDGIEVVPGDARDPAFVARVTEGAAVIYHCMNPSAYTAAAWRAEFPALGDALIAAALRADARLVCLDNLYGYGDVATREGDGPMAPNGPKAQVRADWDARLRSTPGLRWTAGRAGDFFGPGAGAQSLLSDGNLGNPQRGLPVVLVGDPQAPHALSWVPDVVAGLAALGQADDDVEGHAFVLPVVEVAPAALVREVAAAAGRRAWALTVPRWLFAALAPLVPIVRELRETLYQWDKPFRADDRPFRARFPGVATGWPVIVETLAAPQRALTQRAT